MNERQNAAYLISRSPEQVIVEKECPHDGPKDRHHPDYSKPYNVELLCRICHREIDSKDRTYIPRIEKNIGTLGANIRRHRRERGMRGTDLAGKLNIPAQQLSAWENLAEGKSISVRNLEKLMDILGKNASDFLGDNRPLNYDI